MGVVVAGIRKAIEQSNGTITIRLAPGFVCYYDSLQITISKNVTILGSGALLDAFKKGRFFAVESGAHLTLDSLALRNGYYFGGNEPVSFRTFVLYSRLKPFNPIVGCAPSPPIPPFG